MQVTQPVNAIVGHERRTVITWPTGILYVVIFPNLLYITKYSNFLPILKSDWKLRYQITKGPTRENSVLVVTIVIARSW